MSWKLTNTLDTSASIECLQEAIHTHGKPEIINSDQGCQYTSKLWVETLNKKVYKSVWMAKEGQKIIFVFNAFGAQ